MVRCPLKEKGWNTSLRRPSYIELPSVTGGRTQLYSILLFVLELRYGLSGGKFNKISKKQRFEMGGRKRKGLYSPEPVVFY